MENDSFHAAQEVFGTDEPKLLSYGIADEQMLEWISGPCGADSQGETAISIIAGMLAVRAGRAGGRLRDAGQGVHAQAE